MPRKSEESKIKADLILLYVVFGICLVALIAVISGYAISANG